MQKAGLGPGDLSGDCKSSIQTQASQSGSGHSVMYRKLRQLLRNDNSLILQSKVSPFFHGFLQVLDCSHPLGPSIYLENDLLLFIDICYSPQIHFRPSKAKKIDSENGNGVKLAIYPKIEGKWGKLPYFALLCSFNHFFSSQGKQKCICGP